MDSLRLGAEAEGRSGDMAAILGVIRSSAFLATPWPVLLCFEARCGLEDQELLAKAIEEQLGDILHVRPPPERAWQRTADPLIPAYLHGRVVLLHRIGLDTLAPLEPEIPGGPAAPVAGRAVSEISVSSERGRESGGRGGAGLFPQEESQLGLVFPQEESEESDRESSDFSKGVPKNAWAGGPPKPGHGQAEPQNTCIRRPAPHGTDFFIPLSDKTGPPIGEIPTAILGGESQDAGIGIDDIFIGGGFDSQPAEALRAAAGIGEEQDERSTVLEEPLTKLELQTLERNCGQISRDAEAVRSGDIDAEDVDLVVGHAVGVTRRLQGDVTKSRYKELRGRVRRKCEAGIGELREAASRVEGVAEETKGKLVLLGEMIRGWGGPKKGTGGDAAAGGGGGKEEGLVVNKFKVAGKIVGRMAVEAQRQMSTADEVGEEADWDDFLPATADQADGAVYDGLALDDILIGDIQASEQGDAGDLRAGAAVAGETDGIGLDDVFIGHADDGREDTARVRVVVSVDTGDSAQVSMRAEVEETTASSGESDAKAARLQHVRELRAQRKEAATATDQEGGGVVDDGIRLNDIFIRDASESQPALGRGAPLLRAPFGAFLPRLSTVLCPALKALTCQEILAIPAMRQPELQRQGLVWSLPGSDSAAELVLMEGSGGPVSSAEAGWEARNAWRGGCHIVATREEGLADAFFMGQKRSGYSPMPVHLRPHLDKQPIPRQHDVATPRRLKIKVISGYGVLPHLQTRSSGASTQRVGLSMRLVELSGEQKAERHFWEGLAGRGCHPVWDAEQEWLVADTSQALLLLAVSSGDLLAERCGEEAETVAHIGLRVADIRMGYRAVPLLNTEGIPIPGAALLCHVSLSGPPEAVAEAPARESHGPSSQAAGAPGTDGGLVVRRIAHGH